MKEVINKKMVEVEEKYFLSDDGERFESEYSCKMYELQKNSDELLNKYDMIKLFSFNIPYTDWCNDSFGLDVVRLNNHTDYMVMKATLSCDYRDTDFPEPKTYPCIKVIGFDDGYAAYSSYTPVEIHTRLLEETIRIGNLITSYDLTFKECEANS